MQPFLIAGVCIATFLLLVFYLALTVHDANMNICNAAQKYRARGWAVVPLSPLSKTPQIKGWWTHVFTPDNFLQDCNIGIKLGAPSGNLVDTDIDDPLAVELAQKFLLPSAALFGRKSKPNSHWIYICPDSHEGAKRWPTTNGTTIVELRSTGVQTMFPPSINPSGEAVTWSTEGEPARVQWADLVQACEDLATEVRKRRGEPTAPIIQTHLASQSTPNYIREHRLLLDLAALYADNAKPSDEGHRHVQGFLLAKKLAAFCEGMARLTEAEIFNVLQTRWNLRNSPPLVEIELRDTIHSAMIYTTF